MRVCIHHYNLTVNIFVCWASTLNTTCLGMHIWFLGRKHYYRRSANRLEDSIICEKSCRTKTRLHVINFLILSKLTYLVSVWGNTSDSLVLKAQRVQNIAARLATGHRRNVRQSKLLEDCNWLNIKEMSQYHSAIQFWKTLKLERPRHLWLKLQEEDSGHISTDIPRLQITDIAFRCQTTRFWNVIPDTLRSEDVVTRFKAGLRRFIIDRRTQDWTPSPDNETEHG